MPSAILGSGASFVLGRHLVSIRYCVATRVPSCVGSPHERLLWKVPPKASFGRARTGARRNVAAAFGHSARTAILRRLLLRRRRQVSLSFAMGDAPPCTAAPVILTRALRCCWSPARTKAAAGF